MKTCNYSHCILLIPLYYLVIRIIYIYIYISNICVLAETGYLKTLIIFSLFYFIYSIYEARKNNKVLHYKFLVSKPSTLMTEFKNNNILAFFFCSAVSCLLHVFFNEVPFPLKNKTTGNGSVSET